MSLLQRNQGAAGRKPTNKTEVRGLGADTIFVMLQSIAALSDLSDLDPRLRVGVRHSICSRAVLRVRFPRARGVDLRN